MLKTKAPFFKIILWSLVVLLTFCCVLFIPIAWLDEVMDLDPAFNLLKGNGLQSKIWSYSGSDTYFVANLPFRQVPYFLALFVGNSSIYGVRIFFFFIAALSFYMVYKVFTLEIKNKEWLWIFLMLFFFDKGIWESLRSVRTEIMQVGLFAAALYFVLYKQKAWIGLCFILPLVLTHPASWALGLILWIYAFSLLKSTRQKLAYTIISLLPFILWFYSFAFDIHFFSKQFLAASSDHTSNGNILSKIYDHFWKRFFPYYNISPWVFILWIFAHIISIHKVYTSYKNKTKIDILSLLFLGHSIYWFLALAPMHRYNPSMLFIIYFISAKECVPFISKFKHSKIAISIIVFLQSIPFIVSCFLVSTQLQMRQHQRVLNWIEKQIPNQTNVLLGGEAIGAYYAFQKHPKVQYYEPIYPQNIQFEIYTHKYLLSREILPYTLVSNFELVSNKSNFINQIHSRINSHTYNNLYLYKLNTQECIMHSTLKRNGKKW
jgi:hypothetical protein